eukprot:TRINITY_DN39618_c0_g1_i1.p1 TRINITY_DN39618_c0_g1~~TRINITY_DN39618_c0_g1_i1.p1  ORF type:complete len:877 (-),score=92.67 TRINITY_DN39618_c0_g1_i1:165-2795(-)
MGVDWNAFWEASRKDVFVCSALSMASSMVLCVLFMRVPRVRRMPGWIMLNGTLFDLLVSAGMFCISQIPGPFCPPTDDILPYASLLFIVACEVCANAWRLVMYFHLVSVYLNPFNPERYRRLYPLFVYCVAVFTLVAVCLVAHMNEKIGESMCSHNYFLELAVGLFFVPFVTFVLVGGALFVTVRILVFKAMRTAGTHASISFLARQRVMRHGTAYLVLYGAQLAVGIALIFVVISSPDQQEVTLWHFVVTLTCGRPTISFLGWLVINDVVYILCGVCSFTKPGRPFLPRWSRPAQLVALTQDTYQEGGQSVVSTTDSVRTESQERQVHGTISLSEIHDRLTLVRSAMERRAQSIQGIEEAGFKEELRFELIYDVAYAIGELAQKEFHFPSCIETQTTSFDVALLDDRRESLDPLPQLTARRAQSMQADSGPRMPRRSSSDSTMMDMPELPVAEFRRTPSAGYERTTPGMGSRATHYGVSQFHSIREACGISPAAYARAFPNDLSELDSNWRKRLKESVSEGASGSFFYRVLSNQANGITSRFIVKQITVKEKETLMKLLPKYTEHVQNQKGRTLIQYFGCHSMSLRWTFSGKVYFVVMRNVLPVRQWLTFDLKGATANRRALAAQFLHAIDAEVHPGGGTAYGTLRDWEWMDIAMAVDISAHGKAELAQIVAADAAFLAEAGCLDYSLLVGIHRLPLELDRQARQTHLQELRAAGGYVSIDGQKVYFFGIIDILERYSVRWRIQNMVLKMGYHSLLKGSAAEGISALPPKDYADRFETFIRREVLQLLTPVQSIASESDLGVLSRWRCCRCWPCRGCQHKYHSGGTLSSSQRWAHLWDRRRRGLVRERIEAERADHLRRIEELQEQVRELQDEAV